VFVDRDVLQGSVLWQGSVLVVPAGKMNKPKEIAGAYVVQRVDKIPTSIRATQFVRKVYL
jgi:hypothetical protein